MFQYLLHLCLHTKKKYLQSDLLIAKLFHDQIPQKYGARSGASSEPLGYRSAVRLNRLNKISVSSAEVEVEIFLSNRVKPLHELQSVLDLLCLPTQ